MIPFVRAALLTLLAIAPAAAQEFTAGAIKVSRPWAPAPPNAAQSAGGYMTITNTGTEPDTLIGGTAVIAGRIEVHEMSMTGGVMRMRELQPGLVVKPGETVTLAPGGVHLMLLDLKQQPKAGTPFKGTLVFQKAGTVAVEFAVEPFGTRIPGDGGRAAQGKGKAKGSGSDQAKGSGNGAESAKGSGSGSAGDHAKGSGSGSGSDAAKSSGSGSGSAADQTKGSGSGSR